MANPAHVELLLKGTQAFNAWLDKNQDRQLDYRLQFKNEGVKSWNDWRAENPDIKPDLSGADLSNINLYFGANLEEADLRNANLTNACLEGATLKQADLRNAILRGAQLRKAILAFADLRGADLTEADLRVREFDRAQLNGATLDKVRIASTFVTEMDHWNFLDLATAEGLHDVSLSSQSFVLEYVAEAFGHAQHYYNSYNPSFIDEVLAKLQVLSNIYRNEAPSPEIIEIVQFINAELISHLKRNPKELQKLGWRGFEELIAELLSSYGWSVELTQPSKDNGYDIFGIYKDSSGTKHAWIIECKKWALDRPVGVEIARSLYAVKTDLRVGSAMLATTSHFTKGVKDFKSSRYDFELKDYEAILEWINAYRPNPNGKLYIKDNRLDFG